MEPSNLNWLDRFALAVSPSWGQSRLRARMAAGVTARHYEAASIGRRTANWNRSQGDANAATAPALASLRAHSRDLVRNNAWARNALRVVTGNVVGWGITAKPVGGNPAVAALWKRWAESTECDADRRLDFAGLQTLVLRTIFESGEVLVRRRRRRVVDGLSIPVQLQVLEPDFIDSTKDGMKGEAGGPIVQGVEFDALGKRAAYWLFDSHPGSATQAATASRRVQASDVAHVYLLERPGQVRGVPWLAAAIVTLKDFDEYEDAQLMGAKIAACFSAFVTDLDGTGTVLSEQDVDDPLIETVEPGTISYLKPGQDVKFGTPPVVGNTGFSAMTLRRAAVAAGVTFEDMTGDYSSVNYSSARMSRLRHWQHVRDWRWGMLIPGFCDVAWRWAMEAAQLAGSVELVPAAEWTAPPAPMLEPDREALAAIRRVRGGLATPSEIVREQGGDPDTFFEEYAADQQRLDALGIWLDSDVRRTSQAGLTQARPGSDKDAGDEDEG